MFSSFTWESFITTALIAGGSYYFISTLLLYHREITHLFKSQPATSRQEDDEDSPSNTKFETIIGKAADDEYQQPEVSEAINAADITIGDDENTSQDDVETVEAVDSFSQSLNKPSDDLLIGTVADLLEELKTLVQLVAEYQSEKSECQSLFKTLLERYPNLVGTSYQQAINFYIADTAKAQFPFELSHPEVNSWWPDAIPSEKSRNN